MSATGAETLKQFPSIPLPIGPQVIAVDNSHAEVRGLGVGWAVMVGAGVGDTVGKMGGFIILPADMVQRTPPFVKRAISYLLHIRTVFSNRHH